MESFTIDTVGENDEEQNLDSTKNKNNSVLNLLFSDFNECLKAKFGEKAKTLCDSTPLQISSQSVKKYVDASQISEKRIEARKALEKSIVLNSNFESLHAVPPINISDKKILKQRKAEKEKTRGKKWFDLPATEITEEVKHDLEVLQMRSVLDPKHFYKKNDLKVLPKYFQIGKVKDSPLDFYNNRLTQKERKKTLVDELLADAEFNKYNKRKFKEIITEKQKTHYSAWRQANKLKRKKK